MVAAASLGDVVQQHRDIERAAGLQLLDDARGDRRHIRQFAPLQGVEHPDRLDRVLVDGEDVIGVELHLADDARPVGQIAAEQPRLVQDMQPLRAVGAIVLGVAAAQQIEKDRSRLGVVAQQGGAPLVVDQRPDRQGCSSNPRSRAVRSSRNIWIGAS